MDAPARILLAEDSPQDVEMTLAAFAEHKLSNEIVVVNDGEQALDYLFSRGRFENRASGNPILVLLDLKMPKVDGLEVLRQIKADETLRTTPVVMLTSSQDERDVRGSYQSGANAYVVKPVEFRRFTSILNDLVTFWLNINHPPPVESAVAAASPPPA